MEVNGLLSKADELLKGDYQGHPFRGNQHTSGGGTGGRAESRANTKVWRGSSFSHAEKVVAGHHKKLRSLGFREVKEEMYGGEGSRTEGSVTIYHHLDGGRAEVDHRIVYGKGFDSQKNTVTISIKPGRRNRRLK